MARKRISVSEPKITQHKTEIHTYEIRGYKKGNRQQRIEAWRILDRHDERIFLYLLGYSDTFLDIENPDKTFEYLKSIGAIL